MKIAAIKPLVEAHSIDELRKAEDAILNEAQPEIEVQGSDEGEQLTHVLAAIWIKHQMQEHDLDFTTALRQYSARVRTSIS